MNTSKTTKVAMVDDHDLLRGGICKLIEKFGFEIVFEAENGKVALAQLENIAMLPEVCIVDVNMPVMNGVETTKAIKVLYPDIKVLAFSINDDANDVTQMLESGANGYVLKGSDPYELKKAVEVLHRGGQYFSSGVIKFAEQYFNDKKGDRNTP